MEWKGALEWKDVFLFVGVLVSLAIGIGNIVHNLKINRRTLFINSVTTERVKWIDKLRQNISTFAGLTHHWVASRLEDTSKSNPILRELDQLRVLIKLQLNPRSEIDRQIIRKIDEIPDLTHHPDKSKFTAAINELVSLTQILLKQEWDRVKEEARTGRMTR
jgi:hypothetical protein